LGFALETALTTLDAFEGDGYERVVTQATLETNERVDVFVYAVRVDS